MLIEKIVHFSQIVAGTFRFDAHEVLSFLYQVVYKFITLNSFIQNINRQFYDARLTVKPQLTFFNRPKSAD